MNQKFEQSSYLKVLTNNLLRDRCVIMLGPGVAETSDGMAIQQAIQAYFQKETQLPVQYDIDGLLTFNKEKVLKTFYYTELASFYEKHAQPNEMHQQLARIPCHLMISTSPDLRMKRAFYNHEVDFHYYNKRENPQDTDSPTKEKPLLYNLFGSIEEENSLIVTTDDLFEFLFSILGGENRLPRELQNSLKNANVFLFLGFDFEKWYLKLLLRLFRLHQDPMPIVSRQGEGLQNNMRAFYVNNFEMQFLDMDAKSLIKALYDHFEAAGKLRDIQVTDESENENTGEHPAIHQIRNFVKENEIMSALESLEEWVEEFQDGELLNEVTLLFGRYRRIQKKIRRQELSAEAERIQLAGIQNSILDLLDELKQSFASTIS